MNTIVLALPRVAALLFLCGGLSSQSWQSLASIVIPNDGPTAQVRRVPFSPALPPYSLRYDELVGLTYEFSPLINTWLPTLTAANPPLRQDAAMAGGAGNLVFFGGLGATMLADTWVFTPGVATGSGTWTQVNPATSPSARSLHAMAAVEPLITSLPPPPTPAVVYLHGGAGGALLGDLWRYDVGQGWTAVATTNAPSPRLAHSLVSGPGRTLVLFGGIDAGGASAETWSLDLFTLTWSQLPVPVAPPARSSAGMVYDESRGVVVLFGGVDANAQPLFDTWELSFPFAGPNWRQVGVQGPNPGLSPELFFEPQLGRIFASSLSPLGPSLHAFTPSPVAFGLTPDTWSCAAAATLELAAVGTSLPVMGQTFLMQVSGAAANGLLVAGLELAGPGLAIPLGCGCEAYLSGGPNTAVVLVPNVGSPSPFALPISTHPALLGQAVDIQVFHVDGSACWLKSTQLGTAVLGF